MRKSVIAAVSAVLVMFGVVAAQETTAAKPSNAGDRVLIANERALWEAVAKADKASFQSLGINEAVWTTKQGFVPMTLLAGGLGSFSLTKWDIVNPRVTWLDKDSAILTYSWMGTGTYGDQPLASTTLASTVWTKRNGKWLVAHHQETDLIRN